MTSHHQKGGITAGIVNVSPQPRKLDSKLKHQINELLPDKSNTVTVTSVMGDGEAFNFATQLKDYLESQGYDVKGVNQAVFSKPIKGQNLHPGTQTFTIGTRE